MSVDTSFPNIVLAVTSKRRRVRSENRYRCSQLDVSYMSTIFPAQSNNNLSVLIIVPDRQRLPSPRRLWCVLEQGAVMRGVMNEHRSLHIVYTVGTSLQYL